MVVLRFGLLYGVSGEVGSHLHVSHPDFDFLGIDWLAVGITCVDEGEVRTLLLGDAAIDVHIEEGGCEIGAGIRTAGQCDGRDRDPAGLDEVHRDLVHTRGCKLRRSLIARGQRELPRIEKRNTGVSVAIRNVRLTLLGRLLYAWG